MSRREPVMREARSFVGEFPPQTDDELAIVSKGGKTGFVLQVYGYPDMVCAFVRHGMLERNADVGQLSGDVFSVREDPAVFAGLREKLNLPEWMQSIVKVVEGSAKGLRQCGRAWAT